MNKLRGMFLFSRLAELGSFVAVAEDIGSTASMVSKEIQKLEQDIGARLLHRSTRKVQLTPTGHWRPLAAPFHPKSTVNPNWRRLFISLPTNFSSSQ